MRFPSAILCFFILAMNATPVVSSHAQSPADVRDAAEVRHWLDELNEAFVANNLDAAKALYSPNFIVAFDVPGPLQYVGKDTYMALWKAILAKRKGPARWEWNDVHISTSGDMAVIACLFRTISSNDQGVEVEGPWARYTSVLRKQDGKWLGIHDHVSFPSEAGKALMDLKP